MKGDKGRLPPSPQLAMLLPIQGGARVVEEEAKVTPDEEETLRQIVLLQLAKAGLRKSASSKTDLPVTK